MRTHASQLFDELNRKYWRGRLPRYRVIQRATLHGLQGRCNNARRTILLAPHPSPEPLRLTLLHEMCHIGTPYHGRRFQANLERLACQGEAWARFNVEPQVGGVGHGWGSSGDVRQPEARDRG